MNQPTSLMTQQRVFWTRHNKNRWLITLHYTFTRLMSSSIKIILPHVLLRDTRSNMSLSILINIGNLYYAMYFIFFLLLENFIWKSGRLNVKKRSVDGMIINFCGFASCFDYSISRFFSIFSEVQKFIFSE